MAVDSMHLGVWSWSRQSPELKVRMGKKGDLSNLEHGMVVGCSHTIIFRVCKDVAVLWAKMPC